MNDLSNFQRKLVTRVNLQSGIHKLVFTPLGNLLI